MQDAAILAEYREVLFRPKFPFNGQMVEMIISAIRDFGVDTQRTEVKGVYDRSASAHRE